MTFATALSFGIALLAGTAQPQTRPITVIELFTSQGCSSCPPANANLAILARRPDVLAPSFGVNYWDYLGWRDTFASQTYTNRQRDYARGLGRTNVYTPQMVINGRVDTVGGNLTDLNRMLGSLPTLGQAITIATTSTTVNLSASTPLRRPASIWLVRYDPRTVQVPIQRGENRGKTLPHVNVVQELTRLGDYNGRATAMRLTGQNNSALRSAILVQAADSGPIMAAAKF
jgi:hypothetical protein